MLRLAIISTLNDGGEMVVTANDPSGKSSIGEIRMQLMHIARMFSDGNGNAPTMIRDRNSFFPILDHQTGVALTVGS
jgi:hypothetical protein